MSTPAHKLVGRVRRGLPGKVRTGQRTPYRKATAAEVQERVEEVAEMRARRATKGEVKRHLLEKYGLHFRTVEEIYIARADRLLVERAAMSAAQAKTAGVSLLLDVMKHGTFRERLSAESRLAEVYGYNAPRRHEVTGADGGPLATKDETAPAAPEPEKIRALLALAPAATWRRPSGNGGNGGGKKD